MSLMVTCKTKKCNCCLIHITHTQLLNISIIARFYDKIYMLLCLLFSKLEIFIILITEKKGILNFHRDLT